MGEFWWRPAESVIESDVFWCGRKPFFAADDMGDFHEVVVDDIGEVVGREVVGFHEDLVVDGFAVELDIAANEVFEFDDFVRDFLANDEGDSFGEVFGDFGFGEVEAFAVVHCGLAAGDFLGAHFFEAFFGAEAAVGVACVEEFLDLFAVKFGAF